MLIVQYHKVHAPCGEGERKGPGSSRLWRNCHTIGEVLEKWGVVVTVRTRKTD